MWHAVENDSEILKSSEPLECDSHGNASVVSNLMAVLDGYNLYKVTASEVLKWYSEHHRHLNRAEWQFLLPYLFVVNAYSDNRAKLYNCV